MNRLTLFVTLKQKMDINSVQMLVKYIKSANDDNATKALIEYGNKRETHGIDEAWRRSRKLLSTVSNNKIKRIKNEMVGYSQEVGAISLVDFTMFFAAVEDALQYYAQRAPKEVGRMFADVNDYCYQKLGNVSIDRRIIPPSKKDEETFDTFVDQQS